jgi:GTP cyclohydrolase II
VLKFIAETLLPTKFGDFKVMAYRDDNTGVESLALIVGDVSLLKNVPTRIHDQCLTSEVFGSLKCDCHDQLTESMKRIQANKLGIIIYLQQEGRGIGLANKIAAYSLQELGYDTVDANRALGFPDDCREYKPAAFILNDLQVKSVELMTNNPRKMIKLEEEGVEVSARLPIVTTQNIHSSSYLETKIKRMGHIISESR